MTTAARMTAPEIAICQKGEIWITGRAFMTMPRKQRAEQRARHRADAAADGDAADDAGGDDGELVAVGDLGIGDAVARHPEIAAEAGDGAGDGVGEELLPAQVDAAIARRDRDCRRRRRGRGPAGVKLRKTQNRIETASAIQTGVVRPRRTVLREGLEGHAHLGGVHLVAAGDDDDHAAEDGERAERHDDRRDAEKGDQRAVEEAEHQPDGDAGEDHEDERRLGVVLADSAASMPDRARLAATDRSMPRVRMTTICASAIMNRTDVSVSRSLMFSHSRKTGC